MSARAADAPLRIAMLGLGTVGREVARELLARGDDLGRRCGRASLDLVAIGVREPDRDRGIRFPAGTDRTDDLLALATSPDIDVVVELLGGLEPAGELVRAAIESGHAVVTANKALLARRGPELEALARERGVALRFEAAVGGGIPVLAPLARDLAANGVSRVRGIVNGTTNYILDQIFELHETYEAVLAEAQALGYAEADPRGDVEGMDAVHKLVLLSRLAFGGWLDPDVIVKRLPTVRGEARPGITGILYDDLDAAGALEHEIKLIAECRLTGSGGAVEASVVPMLVPGDTPLARTKGADNRVEITADPIGRVAFAGPGAGGRSTSSAVLGDLIAVGRGDGSTWAGLPEPGPLTLERGAAGAGLLEPRPWFAFLPEVSADELGRAYVDEAVERPNGTGVLTTPVELQRIRRGMLRILPDGVDALLYPVIGGDD